MVYFLTLKDEGDLQPVENGITGDAILGAYDYTHANNYVDLGKLVLSHYLGHNQQKIALLNLDGSVMDGILYDSELDEIKLNSNKGAEPLITYLSLWASHKSYNDKVEYNEQLGKI